MREHYQAVGAIQRGLLQPPTDLAILGAIRDFPDGPVVVTIETTTAAAARSLSANAYQWTVFAAIAAETGHTKDEIHDLMCAMFLSYPVDVVDRQTGDVSQMTVTRGTSGLKRKEHTEFLARVQQWAGEFLGMEFA